MLCAGNKHQRFLSLGTIFNIKHARNSFSSLTTKDKIFVASDKNRAVYARLYVLSIIYTCSMQTNLGIIKNNTVILQIYSYENVKCDLDAKMRMLNSSNTASVVNIAKSMKYEDSFCRRSYFTIHQKAAISTYNINRILNRR